MQNKFDENGLLKKEYWEPGEWHDEPDTFEMTYKGYKCEGRRNAMGSWCGYVGIPTDDPFYKNHIIDKSYDDVPLNAHGGITYESLYEEDKVYWVGFDCAHYNDYLPSRKGTDDALKEMYASYKTGLEDLEKKYPQLKNSWPETGIYRNIKFVKKQLKSMINEVIKKNKE